MHFAEHVCQLLKAVLHNLDASRNIWAAISHEKVENVILNWQLDLAGSGGKDWDSCAVDLYVNYDELNIRVFILFTQNDFINYTLGLAYHSYVWCMHKFQRVAEEDPSYKIWNSSFTNQFLWAKPDCRVGQWRTWDSGVKINWRTYIIEIVMNDFYCAPKILLFSNLPNFLWWTPERFGSCAGLIFCDPFFLRLVHNQ